MNRVISGRARVGEAETDDESDLVVEEDGVDVEDGVKVGVDVGIDEDEGEFVFEAVCELVGVADKVDVPVIVPVGIGVRVDVLLLVCEAEGGDEGETVREDEGEGEIVGMFENVFGRDEWDEEIEGDSVFD